ncbi:hypothetical protein Taro_036127 [Colocasia esculenta]|uniref:Uncharacterized protein n=1 Tax=Colocasia esculenta TaxID=4460 RepID=A0A843W7K6_COLES|nr:hypothetical protein [Colocasia esculenta]
MAALTPVGGHSTLLAGAAMPQPFSCAWVSSSGWPRAFFGRATPAAVMVAEERSTARRPTTGRTSAPFPCVLGGYSFEAMLIAAESKREEEKAKGVNMDDSTENPDIVPFEDNEEEEEDSEEEEEGSGQASLGRGRGRGLMWPPHMPMVRGGRPMLGVRGFPPMMMGADGFGFGAVTPDGFAAPDLFGPRMFQPFGGPRFSGNFSGLAQPGAIFPGTGLGMMMGGGRAPFMGGMAMAGVGAVRANRPMGMPPLIRPPLPPSANPRILKRDQRRSASDQSERYEAGSDQGNKGHETAGLDDQTRFQPGAKQYDGSFGPRGSFRDDESESEDEAPRRSRHGEGKRKRRGSDGETISDQWETPNE